MFTKKRGFTLIELLVVVAIIGLLATIITAVVYNAKSKSRDTRVKTSLSQIRAVAAMVQTEDGSYSQMCTGSDSSGNVTGSSLNDAKDTSSYGLKIIKNEVMAVAQNNPICYATNLEYCVQASLPSGGNICVDSDGNTIETAGTGSCKAYNVKCTEQP